MISGQFFSNLVPYFTERGLIANDVLFSHFLCWHIYNLFFLYIFVCLYKLVYKITLFTLLCPLPIGNKIAFFRFLRFFWPKRWKIAISLWISFQVLFFSTITLGTIFEDNFRYLLLGVIFYVDRFSGEMSTRTYVR